MIIFVDDEPDNVKCHHKALDEAGFQVERLDTTDECLRLIETAPDVQAFILDVMLPPGSLGQDVTNSGESTGFVLLRRIREVWPVIPVLLLTNRTDLVKDEIYDEGRTILLSKSHVRPSDLVSLVRQAVERSET